MKTHYKLVALAVACLLSLHTQAQRYFEEVFTAVDKTADVTYANNIAVLTGSPTPTDLKMDIYEPAGDTETERPLVVYIHTGSFLPLLINGTPTGSKTDSSVVEMCKQFARRGYVAASMDYRLGWNPVSPEQDMRTGTLLQAVYRAILDAKACVRYFKMNYSTQGNTYGVDTNRIILVGQGTGGYIALAYATLDKVSEIQLLKFISGSDLPPLFTAGMPYVDQSILGNFEGTNATPGNIPNNVGYSSRVRMVVNMGGALGDSSWLEPGDVPIVAFHVTNDPFAPYANGTVVVPTTGQFVVDVSGSRKVIEYSEEAGNQDVFDIPYSDPYTARANQVNEGYEGLFPFVKPATGPPFFGQAGPWEWVNPADLYAIAPFLGQTALDADTALGGAMLTNPEILNKAHAMAYIDTIQGYLAPRIVQVLQLPGFYNSIEFLLTNDNATLYPNPANNTTVVKMDGNALVESVAVFDASGRSANVDAAIDASAVYLNTSRLAAGVYTVKLNTNKGIATARLIKK